MTLKEQLIESVRVAHAKDREYMDTHFSLGSAFDHCSRLESYLTLEARAALKIGLLSLNMPSEYHNPYITVSGDLDNIDLAKLDSAKQEIAERDARIAAIVAEQNERYAWQKLNEVEAGKVVRVMRGRKLPKGLTGVVKRLMPNDYDQLNPKVAIGTCDGLTHFTYANNCDVLLPTIG